MFKCDYDDEECSRRAIYGYDLPTRCKEHKEEGMKNKSGRRCNMSKCKIRATFGFPENKSTRCKKHKEEGMIDVANKKCDFLDCKKAPTYGLENETAKRCFEHVLEGMVLLRYDMCNVEDCKKRANFGFSKKALRCKDHIEEGMSSILDFRF